MIESVTSAIKKNEAVDVYYTFMSGDFQNKTVLGSFQEMIEFYAPLRTFESLEVLEANKKDIFHQTWKSVALHQKDNLSTAQFALVKENGFWKIAALDLLSPNQLPQDPEGIIQSQLQAILPYKWLKRILITLQKNFKIRFPCTTLRHF